MAGGYWESQNKVRPGAYVNFETNDLSAFGLDSTGPVAIPIKVDWGESNKFIKVTPNSNIKELFGKSLKELLPIREAFKGSGEIIAYNLNGEGEKATDSLKIGEGEDQTDGFTATALYGGADGNKINVTVVVGVDDSVTVKTYFDGSQVDSQIIDSVSELESNAFVTFSGPLPKEDATLSLSGGSTESAVNDAYSDFAEGLDSQEFKTIAIGTYDDSVKSIFTLKVREWRENTGKNVSLVTNNYADADFEGVVSVKNGVVLEDNESLTAEDAVYFYAAAYASAGTDSLTYTEYPGAIACERLTHDEIVQALKDGHIVYTHNNDRVVIEQDINTFRTFTVEKNQDFRKNKLVRSMDIVSDNVQYVFSTFFIGRVTNNEDGRDLFKQQLMKVVLDPLVQRGAIEYESGDILIEQGEDKDAVLVNMAVTFNDAMEKLYMTVACQ